MIGTTRLERGRAIVAAATAVITATHGPRQTIKPDGWLRARQTDASRTATAMLASMDSMGEAFAWDRKVSALVRAIAGEGRVIA